MAVLPVACLSSQQGLGDYRLSACKLLLRV